MRTPLATTSRLGFIAGLALFVVGGGTAAYLALRSPGTPSPDEAAQVQVYVTARPIDTGTTGQVVITGDLLRARPVDAADVPANAVTNLAQVAGGVAAMAIPGGTVVTADMFSAPQTRIGTVVIPPGKRALALKLDPVPGVAGFAGAGDLVDVYGVIRGADPASSRVQLVLQAVEVLNVNGSGLPTSQGVADGPSLVYLLAVTPFEAERLIYLTEFNKLYFDLVAKGEPPVATPGAGQAEALQGL